MKIKALHLIVDGSGNIEPGTEFDVDAALGDELIAKGAAAAVAAVEEKPAAKKSAAKADKATAADKGEE